MPENRKPVQRNAWLIGASRGMGLETARLLADRGWRLTLSSRGGDALEAACASLGATAEPLDITDQTQVMAVARRICQVAVPDLVIINAGDYQPMPIEAFDVELFEQLNRVNYLGVVYVLGALLTPMRTHGGGQIVVNASSAAYRGLPRAAPYSAPKAATLHLFEALKTEARQWNIDLRVINPGFVRSDLTRRNRFPMPALMEPADAARRIVAGLESATFEITFPRRLTWVLKLLRCLPYRLYFAITGRLVDGHD